MKRVVVTGLGVVSSIGNNAAEVTRSLRDGKSGIEFVPQYRDLGFRSQVAGTLKMNVDELVDRRLRRFMGDGAAFAYLAMKEAIADAGLSEADISNERTGVSSPPPTNSRFSKRRTSVVRPVNWAPCCGVRACIRRIWLIGVVSARPGH